MADKSSPTANLVYRVTEASVRRESIDLGGQAGGSEVLRQLKNRVAPERIGVQGCLPRRDLEGKVNVSPALRRVQFGVVCHQARGRVAIARLMHGAKLLPQSKVNRRRSSAGTAAVNEASNLRVTRIRFESRLIAHEMGVDR